MSKTELHPKLTIQFFTEEKCFGPGVATLLERVREHHSLRAAAMSMSMAYSKAWTILKNAEHALCFPLLHTTTGGRQGGGAVLSEQAERLLAAYNEYVDELNAHSQVLFAEKFDWLR